MGICNIQVKTDLKNKSYNALTACKQGDTLILEFEIFDNSMMADLTGFVCDLWANKADGTGYQKITGVTVTTATGKATIKCPGSLTQFAGKLLLELTFTDTINDLQKTTFDINIQVDKSVIGNSDGTLPRVILTELEDLKESLAQISDKVAQATAINNTLTNTNNTANNLNSALQSTINSADVSKTNLDISINLANNLKKELLDEDSKINQHVNNVDIHVTKEQKDKWDLAALNLTQVINILDKTIGTGTLVDENGDSLVDETGAQFMG